MFKLLGCKDSTSMIHILSNLSKEFTGATAKTTNQSQRVVMIRVSKLQVWKF